MRRRSGFVMGWLTIEQAASATEWHRSQMYEAIAFGEVPAVTLRSGEVMVLAPAIAGWDRRLSEH